MKKTKKILALLCATSMLLSSIYVTSFAAGADLDSSEAGGDSIVEVDNSTKPNITNVVVPTITTSTYDFTIDPENLLYNFNNSAYETGKMVYFSQSTISPAVLEINDADGATYKWAVKGKVVDTDLEGLTSVLVKSPTIAKDAIDEAELSKFYVWVPDGTVGAGKYVALTKANLESYIKLSVDGSSKITGIAVVDNPLVERNVSETKIVFDGKVYKDGYTVITDAEAPDYYDGTAFSSDIKIQKTITDGGAVSYITPVAGTDDDTVTITPAVKKSTNSTDSLIIKNKSTYDVAVTATVTLKDATGFAIEGATFADATKASLSLGIADSGKVVKDYVDATKKTATAHYVLTGTGDSAYRYQASGSDELTGGHVYKQYLQPNAEGSQVAFRLVANATNAIDAWKAYAKTIDGTTVKKPSITVVYSFTKVTQDTQNTKKFVAENKDSYTVDTLETNMWATYAAGIPTYAVTVSGGTADLTTAAADSTVTITPTNQSATGIKVKKTSDSTDVTSSVNVSGFTFKMPAYPVTVEVLTTVAASVPETATYTTGQQLEITCNLGTPATTITKVEVKCGTSTYSSETQATHVKWNDNVVTISSTIIGKSPTEVKVYFANETSDTCNVSAAQ